MKNVECIGFQGDVCIFKIDSFPKDLIENKQTKNAILAYGELTGHAHQFEDVESVNVFTSNADKYKGIFFIDVLKENAKLQHGRARDFIGKEADHDYHNVIELIPGQKYMAGIVEETDWLTRTIRKVID